ncbi:MAG: hypothetical protein WCP97_04030 [bacterium]
MSIRGILESDLPVIKKAETLSTLAAPHIGRRLEHAFLRHCNTITRELSPAQTFAAQQLQQKVSGAQIVEDLLYKSTVPLAWINRRYKALLRNRRLVDGQQQALDEHGRENLLQLYTFASQAVTILRERRDVSASRAAKAISWAVMETTLGSNAIQFSKVESYVEMISQTTLGEIHKISAHLQTAANGDSPFPTQQALRDLVLGQNSVLNKWEVVVRNSFADTEAKKYVLKEIENLQKNARKPKYGNLLSVVAHEIAQQGVAVEGFELFTKKMLLRSIEIINRHTENDVSLALEERITKAQERFIHHRQRGLDQPSQQTLSAQAVAAKFAELARVDSTFFSYIYRAAADYFITPFGLRVRTDLDMQREGFNAEEAAKALAFGYENDGNRIPGLFDPSEKARIYLAGTPQDISLVQPQEYVAYEDKRTGRRGLLYRDGSLVQVDKSNAELINQATVAIVFTDTPAQEKDGKVTQTEYLLPNGRQPSVSIEVNTNTGFTSLRLVHSDNAAVKPTDALLANPQFIPNALRQGYEKPAEGTNEQSLSEENSIFTSKEKDYFRKNVVIDGDFKERLSKAGFSVMRGIAVIFSLQNRPDLVNEWLTSNDFRITPTMFEAMVPVSIPTATSDEGQLSKVDLKPAEIAYQNAYNAALRWARLGRGNLGMEQAVDVPGFMLAIISRISHNGGYFAESTDLSCPGSATVEGASSVEFLPARATLPKARDKVGKMLDSILDGSPHQYLGIGALQVDQDGNTVITITTHADAASWLKNMFKEYEDKRDNRVLSHLPSQNESSLLQRQLAA